MAAITVRFYSLWRHHLGRDNVTLQAEDIDGALTQIEDDFGPQLQAKLEASGIHLGGSIRDNSLILLNGTALRNLKGTQLKDGDVLHIFPPGIGG